MARDKIAAGQSEAAQPAEGPRTQSGANIGPPLLAASLVATLLFCGGLLIYGSGRGLDLTDEIFYLVWTRDPSAYALMYQPFGYLLHPLYRFVGGDLQNYRLIGFAIAAGAGAFVGCSLPSAKDKGPIYALYGAQSALTIFFPWIITPSYNSAANVGALLIIGGLLNAFKGSLRAGIVASLAIASGLCIAAFSKPPMFVIAFAAIALAAILARGARRTLIASLLLGAAAMTLFIPLTEIPLLVRRIVLTQHILALPNTPLALPGKILRDWIAVPLPLTGAAIAAVLSLALRPHWLRTWLGYAAIALSFYYVETIIPDAIDGSIPDFLGLSVMTMAIGYAGLVDDQGRASRLPIWLLFAAPVVVALGTFNNQWFQLNFSMACPFLALFALAGMDDVGWRRGAAQAVSLAGSAAVMLLASWAPYSLPAPIFDQQIPIRPPLARGEILVDDETATFVHSAQDLAPGALLIDLSGTGPGVGAVLGARPPVLPWLNPATPTWPDVVWSRLSLSQRQAAWFVIPVWPQFQNSEPARWLMNHKAGFCALALPPITFWDEERSLQILRPCTSSDPRHFPQQTPSDAADIKI